MELLQTSHQCKDISSVFPKQPHTAYTGRMSDTTGRMSDKAIALQCGYLDKVPPYSTIIDDKEFNISIECSDTCITWYVPPGKRGQSQIPSTCVQKTKQIANHRILIEQVIRRLKTFRVLANEIPLSLIGHDDDVVCVCVCVLYYAISRNQYTKLYLN